MHITERDPYKQNVVVYFKIVDTVAPLAFYNTAICLETLCVWFDWLKQLIEKKVNWPTLSMHLNSLDLAMRTKHTMGPENACLPIFVALKYYLITSEEALHRFELGKCNNFLRKAPSIYLYYAVISNKQRDPLHLIGCWLGAAAFLAPKTE